MQRIEMNMEPWQDPLFSESIATLCTNLIYASKDGRKILLTSAHDAEGKTTLGMNLALMMGKLQKRAVLIDLDLRDCSLVRLYDLRFGTANPEGITQYFLGLAKPADIVYQLDDSGACTVPVTTPIADPNFLLEEDRLQALFQYLASSFDYLIVDAPPLITSPESWLIARNCDGALIVTGYNMAKRKEIREISKRLEQEQCPVIAAVLNRAEPRSCRRKH